jgi:hypothetical protein
MKFVTRTGEPSESHAFETVLGLEMGKAHLNALAFISRLEEALCPHQPSRHVAGIFVNITGPVGRPYSDSIASSARQASQSNLEAR